MGTQFWMPAKRGETLLKDGGFEMVRLNVSGGKPNFVQSEIEMIHNW